MDEEEEGRANLGLCPSEACTSGDVEEEPCPDLDSWQTQAGNGKFMSTSICTLISPKLPGRVGGINSLSRMAI